MLVVVSCDQSKVPPKVSQVSFDNKFVIFHMKVKSTAVFLHDATMIPPFPLLFFGGTISVERDGDQQIIAVDRWIKFQAPHCIAMLVKVCTSSCTCVVKHSGVQYVLMLIACGLVYIHM